jgi:hypothetical protein
MKFCWKNKNLTIIAIYVQVLVILSKTVKWFFSTPKRNNHSKNILILLLYVELLIVHIKNIAANIIKQKYQVAVKKLN